jgi:hypothetical protein
MRRDLVVANQTLGGDRLMEAVRERTAEGESHFHLLVPASHPSSAWTEGEVKALAKRRLERAMGQLAAIGARVTGEVGDPSPTRAIADVLLAEPFDEIILSTLPAGPSRWLRQDVVHRVQRTFAVPCTHIIGEREGLVSAGAAATTG